MRQTLATLLLAFGLAARAQAPMQLTQVPPKPTCTLPLFNPNVGPCADLWRAYKQALAQRQREEIQLYVNRQKELASAAATAPLQQQITDLNKLVADQQAQIKKLQDQMQADAAAATETRNADSATASQEKTAAHKQGLWQGLGIGAAVMLLLYIALFVIRRFARNFTITKKSQAASA